MSSSNGTFIQRWIIPFMIIGGGLFFLTLFFLLPLSLVIVYVPQYALLALGIFFFYCFRILSLGKLPTHGTRPWEWRKVTQTSPMRESLADIQRETILGQPRLMNIISSAFFGFLFFWILYFYGYDNRAALILASEILIFFLYSLYQVLRSKPSSPPQSP